MKNLFNLKRLSVLTTVILLVLFFSVNVFGQAARFTFENNLTDATGNYTAIGSNGYSVGWGGSLAAPEGTRCLNLDGTGYYVEIQNVNLTNQFTIAGWLFKWGAPGNVSCILSGPDASFNLTLVNSAVSLTTSQESIQDNDFFSSGAWIHFAITMDKSTGDAVLYKNGVQAATGNVGTVFSTTGNIRLGNNGIQSNLWGYMDDVRIFNDVLDGNAITCIANGNEPGCSSSSSGGSSSGGSSSGGSSSGGSSSGGSSSGGSSSGGSSSGGSSSGGGIPVTGISVNSGFIIPALEVPYQLTAQVLPGNATNQDITWRRTENFTTSFFTLYPDGTVIGHQEGMPDGYFVVEAVTVDGGFTGQCALNIDVSAIPVTGITLDNAEVLMHNIGQTKQLSAQISPVNATNQSILWTSSDVSVVMVNNNGLVTAVGNGRATITAASVENHTIAQQCDFYVDTDTRYYWSTEGSTLFHNDFNIGIGTTNATEKLTVNGNIVCERLRVIGDVQADYVFKPDYKLLSIDEVERFIDQNHHLPNIPSANDFAKNGYSVGDMDNMLLEKIEEQTLYIIELHKKIQQLELLISNPDSK